MSSIEGYDNYVIFEDGMVINMDRGNILKASISNSGGYNRIGLHKDGKEKKIYIHRLLVQTFIDNPENKPCIDHINHNRLDNRLDNLRWATSQENTHNQSLSKNNTSGYQGIYLTKWNTFRASININKKKVRKTFKTLEEAIRWRNEMVEIHYPSRPSIETTNLHD